MSLKNGVINETFLTLERVQDDDDPQFAFGMIDLFISTADSVLLEINNALRDLRQINLVLADEYVLQLKGSTSCIGITRIKRLTESFRTYYLQGYGCPRIVNDLKQE